MAQENTDSGRRKPVRRPLLAHFNRIEKILDLTGEEKAAMEDDWTFIGYDTSEQLAVIPRQHYVIAYKRAKYVPQAQRGSRSRTRCQNRLAPGSAPPQSIAHSSVIAEAIIRKLLDGRPFYRQETIYARAG